MCFLVLNNYTGGLPDYCKLYLSIQYPVKGIEYPVKGIFFAKQTCSNIHKQEKCKKSTENRIVIAYAAARRPDFDETGVISRTSELANA